MGRVHRGYGHAQPWICGKEWRTRTGSTSATDLFRGNHTIQFVLTIKVGLRVDPLKGYIGVEAVRNLGFAAKNGAPGQAALVLLISSEVI